MAQAMQAAATEGAPPPIEEDVADGSSAKASIEEQTPGAKASEATEEEPFTIDTVEQALQILESSSAPKGVAGCSSAEACAGGFRDGLRRFDGFEEHVYCSTCVKILQNQYSALKKARTI